MTEFPGHDSYDHHDTHGGPEPGQSPKPDASHHPSLPYDGWDAYPVDARSTDAPVVRERLFSRKALILWALLALAVYAGLHGAINVVKQSFRVWSQETDAEENPAGVPGGVGGGVNSKTSDVIIVLPNGKKITINRTGVKAPLPDEPPTPPAPDLSKKTNAPTPAPGKSAPPATKR